MNFASTLNPAEPAVPPSFDAPAWGSPLELAHPGPVPAMLEAHAGLTLAALGRDASLWIDAYQQQGPVSIERPDGFLEFVIALTRDRVVGCMARFERALSVARAAAGTAEPVTASAGDRLRLNPAACVIDLPGPAEEVIGAVALGMSPPAYAGWPVLVAPGLPTLWRQATPFEDALCTWLTRPRTVAEVREHFVGAEQVIQRLMDAQVIINAD